ncbi:hypothetical protein TSAR_007664 [Trichomalopsis sarcophagae]|uniref:Uncharacterized protein n=1 Tax=Trichomalopsis sarcophagae TaxID=543379 RepID=A0A232FDP9_9HYME|nr:hypothetical protein TSAR_007664 [Trichomalopsis sarcophagae]
MRQQWDVFRDKDISRMCEKHRDAKGFEIAYVIRGDDKVFFFFFFLFCLVNLETAFAERLSRVLSHPRFGVFYAY